MILESEVVSVGKEAQRFLNEGILLLFPAESVMTQVKNYSIMTNKLEVNGQIKVGDQLSIGDEQFKITAVGNIAQQNLEKIGHATFKADGSTQAELPGTIYLEVKDLPTITVGEKIMIK